MAENRLYEMRLKANAILVSWQQITTKQINNKIIRSGLYSCTPGTQSRSSGITQSRSRGMQQGYNFSSDLPINKSESRGIEKYVSIRKIELLVGKCLEHFLFH